MTTESNTKRAANFYPELHKYVTARIAEFDLIPKDRQNDLGKVAAYIRSRLETSATAKLIFICTHNSRRSHLTQIWAYAAARYYELSNVETFSGGTEATAFNPRAVAALQRAGLSVTALDGNASNPRYQVRISVAVAPQECFSKVYDAAPNPTKDYCAIMTCSQADEACPVVIGCDLRVPIRYEDPKAGDDSEHETALYDARTRQICREMFFMMSLV